MSAMSDRAQNVIQTIGAIAAMVAAIVALFAFVFSTPHELNNWWQVTVHGYSVTINKPNNNAAVGNVIEVQGTAKLPLDWDLVVLVQTPQEEKYYIVSDGSVTVSDSGTWHLSGVHIGDAKLHALELNADYKIFALLVDEEGQQQVEAALSRPGAWMANLPHSAAMAIRKVHLAP